MTGPAVRHAALTWLEARLYVAAAFVVSHAVFAQTGPRTTVAPFERGLFAWDGDWYLRIAEQGYLNADDPSVRFFPLFPLLSRWLGWLIGTEPALILLANGAALLAGIALYHLTMQETGDPVIAQRTTRLMALFPVGFVLVLAYSEGLFLALSILVFLCLRSRRWWTAALLAFLAGLTRPVAGILALPALYHAVRNRHELRQRPVAALGAGLTVLAAPAGTLTFLLWSRMALGNTWAPVEQQELLRGRTSEPLSRLWHAFNEGIRGDEGELFHFFAAIAIIALAVAAVRLLSADLCLYVVPSVIFIIASDNLNSMERYALGAFPLLIVAGLLSRKVSIGSWLPTVSAVAMTSICVLALSGAYVP